MPWPAFKPNTNRTHHHLANLLNILIIDLKISLSYSVMGFHEQFGNLCISQENFICMIPVITSWDSPG
jgi:hypothetical protein